MVFLTISEYDAAYFGDLVESGGLAHDAGYTDYLEKVNRKHRFDVGTPNKPYNVKNEGHKKLLETEGLENAAIVELGGGTGTLGQVMIEEGFTWHVVDVANWCFRHKVIPDINFTEQDALSYLQAQGNNSIDAIFSTSFMVIFDTPDLQPLIDEMRSKSKRQIHFIEERPNPTYYQVRTLEQWRDDFNWGPPNRITLIAIETGRILRF